MNQGGQYLPEGFERCGVLARADTVIPVWHSTGRGVGGEVREHLRNAKQHPQLDQIISGKINEVAIVLKFEQMEKTVC